MMTAADVREVITTLARAGIPFWLHRGYEPSERDREDVRALAERFRLEPPPTYR
jgi:hypothetical protein